MELVKFSLIHPLPRFGALLGVSFLFPRLSILFMYEKEPQGSSCVAKPKPNQREKEEKWAEDSVEEDHFHCMCDVSVFAY